MTYPDLVNSRPFEPHVDYIRPPVKTLTQRMQSTDEGEEEEDIQKTRIELNSRLRDTSHPSTLIPSFSFVDDFDEDVEPKYNLVRKHLRCAYS